MKQKLLLYLSNGSHSGNVPIAATLAWLCKDKNLLFDNYYDSYHQGGHFGGGDARELKQGQLTGGTVPADRHFEEFYFLLLNFDVFIVCFKETIFLSAIRNLKIPLMAHSDRVNDLYKRVFDSLDTPLPRDIVMIGSQFERALSGLEAYLYPEIYYRRAIGVPDSVPHEDLADLYQEGSRILCFYVDKNVIARLKQRGYEVEVVDQLNTTDDYLSVTGRSAKRWIDKTRGWILGDPTLISHWLPTACEEDLIAVYSVPQEKILSELGDLIASRGNVVYGRQYGDQDFFELSKLNQCLQVIDPCRPPFQSSKHVEYTWQTDQNQEGFYGPEYSDEELRQFAREGRILISLMFWSGMIREIANFYNLMDLFIMSKLRCGLVLTAQSYEYMMHAPVELLITPLERGGVYPLVEPVLGSCGVGVGIESCMTKNRLRENLEDALTRILRKVKDERYLPRGWWTAMDTNLEKLDRRRHPKPVQFIKYPPYLQIRFHAKDKTYETNPDNENGNRIHDIKKQTIQKVKQGMQKAGLAKYFLPYRPYEFYEAGSMDKDIIETAKAAGLQYMFTKAGFHSYPEVKYRDEEFIALNYTAGQWDGWTPFETINDISDLRQSEKVLLRRNRPGWIVSTIDSCLWTFSGEFWKRGNELYKIAQFCSQGGASQKLINVKPFTVARYARIIAEESV